MLCNTVNRRELCTITRTKNFAQVKSMDDNCGEWVECMGVASACGEQVAGVASGNGWNLCLLPVCTGETSI